MINLLITGIGRDLMSLIGLSIVMVSEDPVMSLIGFVAAPPAFFFLRKLIRRVRGIAQMQFTGGTRIIETMQEALQGMRMVKAFGLEEEMRRRLAASVAAVEHESNKMARVANRASPVMEMLGGFTVALAIDLRRLPRDRNGRDAGRVCFVHGGVPARLRAGQAPGAAQHRPQ